MKRAFLVALLACACLPTLRSPAGAQLRCGGDDDCPDDLVCLAKHGVCEPRDGPCVETVDDVTAPIDDGSACLLASGAGVCVGGTCAPSSCGDGIVDRRLAEECDDGEDNGDAPTARCLSTCVLPSCGDGIVQQSEDCEGPAPNATCTPTCALSCDAGFGDCNANAADGCECQTTLLVTSTFNEEGSAAFPPALESVVFFLSFPILQADGDDLWFADAGFVFFLESGADEITWVVDGSNDFYFTKDVALDEEFFYWTQNQQVARVGKDFSNPVVVAGGIGDTTLPTVAVDEENIYFTTQFTVARIDQALTAYAVLALMAGFNATLAVDDDAVYVSDLDGGAILRAEKQGVPDTGPDPAPEPLVLASDEIDPRGAVARDGFVYWGTGDGAIHRVPTDGGDVEELARADLDADGLVLKGDSLYWFAVRALDGRGVVYRLRLDDEGARPATVMSLDDEVRSLAVGDTRVFATTLGHIFSASLEQ